MIVGLSFRFRIQLQRCFIAPLAVLLATMTAADVAAGQRETAEATPRVERVVRAHATTARIAVDGRMDEAAWQDAEVADKFIQYEPRPGAPAHDATEVRFLYDGDNLYVGARCWDEFPDRMKVTELKEDFTGSESDSLTIFLDTLHDHQTGFSFAVNPAGARRDAQSWADGDQRNEDWDGVWDAAVTIDDKGWFVEFRIPFKTLRFSRASTQDWGLNIYRRTRRSNEESLWSPLPRRYRFRRASLAGMLSGLEGIRQGRNLKVKPFVSGRLDELASGRTTDADGGVDVKYGLTPSITLDGTYRTDFAQVEADQQQVNLTRFNLLFPEKREFFLENSGAFAVAGGGGPSGEAGGNIIPFFSRRIGLSSSGTPIPILGGARLSGKVGDYDVGLLGMRTAKTDTLRANDFLVGRLRRTIRGQSTIGAIVTSRTSALSGDYGRMYGADTYLRFLEKLEVTSYILKTESPTRKGRDQAHLLSVGWRGDDLTVTGLYEDVEPNFSPDVGFVRRGDMGHYSGDAQWRPRPAAGSYLRSYLVGSANDYYTDNDGNLETRESSVYAGLAFQDQSMFRVTGTRTFERLTAPFAIRPTVTIAPGDYTYQRYGVTYNSDRSQPLAGSVNASAGEFWDGDSVQVSGTLELRPSYHFNMEINLSRNHADLSSGAFTTTVLGARILWAFTSKAFLNSFLQYNATTNQFSANTRFNIIHRPLSDLYVVYNEQRDTSSGGVLARGVVLKLTNLFDF